MENAIELFPALCRFFVDNDCSLTEINPLVVTGAGQLLCLDAKVSFDDNAMFRHESFDGLRDLDEEDPAEVRAGEAGLSYVNLDGDILVAAGSISYLGVFTASYRNELILFSFDFCAISEALSLALQLRRIGFEHFAPYVPVPPWLQQEKKYRASQDYRRRAIVRKSPNKRAFPVMMVMMTYGWA